jgi:hypothetical protein
MSKSDPISPSVRLRIKSQTNYVNGLLSLQILDGKGSDVSFRRLTEILEKCQSKPNGDVHFKIMNFSISSDDVEGNIYLGGKDGIFFHNESPDIKFNGKTVIKLDNQSIVSGGIVILTGLYYFSIQIIDDNNKPVQINDMSMIIEAFLKPSPPERLRCINRLDGMINGYTLFSLIVGYVLGVGSMVYFKR